MKNGCDQSVLAEAECYGHDLMAGYDRYLQVCKRLLESDPSLASAVPPLHRVAMADLRNIRKKMRPQLGRGYMKGARLAKRAVKRCLKDRDTP
jgi:hypothetical protein